MYLKVPMNTKGNDYVVGDIHGMYDLLMATLKKLGFDFKKDRLFSVGDLVDRGPKNEACLRLANEDWFYPVRGNHEQFIASVSDGTYEPYVHISNGGEWFYSISPSTQNALLSIVRKLPLLIETEVNGQTVGFVHGDITDWDTSVKMIKDLPEHNIDNDVTAQRLLWGRSRIKNRNNTPSRGIDHIFLGHTPLEDVVKLGNCYYIDTAAVFGNKLTVVRIDEFISKT